MLTPPLKMPAYAPVSSINVDSEAPNANAGPGANSPEIPKSFAICLTDSRPTNIAVLTAIVLIDLARASVIVIFP